MNSTIEFQGRDAIVLPANTTSVDVTDIPTLLAEAVYPRLLAEGALPTVPDGLSTELAQTAFQDSKNVQLYILAKVYFGNLTLAIEKGRRGEAGGIVARLKNTKSPYFTLPDLPFAEVAVDDFCKYVADVYRMTVTFADDELQGTNAALKEPPAKQTNDEEARVLFDKIEQVKVEIEDWKTRDDTRASDFEIKQNHLKPLLAELALLEAKKSAMRGDFQDETPQPAPAQATATPAPEVVASNDHAPAKPNWRHLVQAEAWEHWLRLRASGCNPSVYSICGDMAKWCAAKKIKGDKGQDPKAGTIRNTVLGGGHWTPPHHSVAEAKKHIAQIAQTKVAQTAQ